MAMGMLEAGGVELLTDGLRRADENNPRGYYEYERVKELDKGLDKSWLVEARGKAIKIISFLLPHLPETNRYRVVFMHRNMDEIVTSQNRMLKARGESTGAITDDRLSAMYRDHLDRIRRLLTSRPCFELLELTYADVISYSHQQAERLSTFLGGGLDVERMAAAVDPALHRNRR
jgi:hypothetical protein